MSVENIRDSRQISPLTPEDLELLATPSAELQKRTSVFSFDTDRLKERIGKGEKWQQLIQAHLYLDHVLTQLLVEALAKPDEIQTTRLGFSQKFDLVGALGLLPDHMTGCVQFVNRLRNKIAHNLEFEISQQDEIDLVNCTPKYLREASVTDRKENDNGPPKMHELFYVVILMIDIIRQRHKLTDLEERKAAIRLRTVLERTKGAIYKE